MTLPPGFEIEEEEEVKTSLPKGFKVEKEKPIPGYRSVLKGAGSAVSSLPTNTGPISSNLQKKLLEQYFPTPKSGLYPYVEKGAEGAAEGSKFGPQAILPGAISGVLGEFAEQKGAPAWVKFLAESAPFLKPGKGLKPKSFQKEAVKFLKKEGLTDKEITPLLHSDEKIRKLGKFAFKGGDLPERMSSTHKKLSAGYDRLKELGETKELPRKHITNFENAIQKQYNKLTPNQKKLVEKEIDQLFSQPITARTMIDFAQDVFEKGNVARQSGAKSAKQAVGILKNPVREFLPFADETLAKEYGELDKFWAKKSNIVKRLKPDQLDRALELGEIYGIGKGVLTLDQGLLTKTFGALGARAIATQILKNPNLQNLNQKMLEAAVKNKGPLLERLNKELINKLKEEAPEVAEILEKPKDSQPTNKKQQTK